VGEDQPRGGVAHGGRVEEVGSLDGRDDFLTRRHGGHKGWNPVFSFVDFVPLCEKKRVVVLSWFYVS